MAKSKNANKDLRAPIGQETQTNKMDDAEKARIAIGHSLRLDASHYLRMPEYQEMELFWALSQNGEVDKWLSLGAQPVPRRTKAGKVYKGINDRCESEYEVVPAVSVVEGVAVDAFLLFMTKEDYKKFRIDPKEARNAEIREAMGIGKADSDAKVMPTVKGLKTYAPNVSENSTGLEVQRGPEPTFDA